ncbi:hypothetical protein ACJU26_09740 [Acidithiobacillus sp. M4-SHS-6]|uniref:hypothetical protein n=1 Tax=Acidithiobacillus sp. M4-SHS-6 TaxID=3383024 RepID=UPI0039BE656F
MATLKYSRNARYNPFNYPVIATGVVSLTTGLVDYGLFLLVPQLPHWLQVFSTMFMGFDTAILLLSSSHLTSLMMNHRGIRHDLEPVNSAFLDFQTLDAEITQYILDADNDGRYITHLDARIIERYNQHKLRQHYRKLIKKQKMEEKQRKKWQLETEKRMERQKYMQWMHTFRLKQNGSSNDNT